MFRALLRPKWLGEWLCLSWSKVGLGVGVVEGKAVTSRVLIGCRAHMPSAMYSLYMCRSIQSTPVSIQECLQENIS
jgi:hypothetical protein